MQFKLPKSISKNDGNAFIWDGNDPFSQPSSTSNYFGSGGQTKLNLPLYFVSVSNSSYGHYINAILVGDNPLNFDDWRFIEPQTDQNVYPGMWDMPYGTTVTVVTLTFIGDNSSVIPKVVFQIENDACQLVEYDPDLKLSRSIQNLNYSKTEFDLWNPFIILYNSSVNILYEKTNDDLLRTSDIYVSKLISVCTKTKCQALFKNLILRYKWRYYLKNNSRYKS